MGHRRILHTVLLLHIFKKQLSNGQRDGASPEMLESAPSARVTANSGSQQVNHIRLLLCALQSLLGERTWCMVTISHFAPL